MIFCSKIFFVLNLKPSLKLRFGEFLSYEISRSVEFEVLSQKKNDIQKDISFRQINGVHFRTQKEHFNFPCMLNKALGDVDQKAPFWLKPSAAESTEPLSKKLQENVVSRVIFLGPM